jgi:hypothetical protein
MMGPLGLQMLLSASRWMKPAKPGGIKTGWCAFDNPKHRLFFKELSREGSFSYRKKEWKRMAKTTETILRLKIIC